ncbi:hypothetical protein [Pricia sp.]|uniref:hypothetical protein n=1 Tax=Pricia sp. TaxID=2268138 RepID=UPI00359425A0
MGSTVKRLDYSGENFYVGLDTHLKNWKSTVLVGNTFFQDILKRPECGDPVEILKEEFSRGELFYRLPGELQRFRCPQGANKIGNNEYRGEPGGHTDNGQGAQAKGGCQGQPQDSGTTCGVKTGGQNVPGIEREGDRSMVRFRKTLTKEIARNKRRAKSFLYYHGIGIPERFANKARWSKRFTLWLKELDLLMGITGIGLITEVVLLTELGDI